MAPMQYSRCQFRRARRLESIDYAVSSGDVRFVAVSAIIGLRAGNFVKHDDQHVGCGKAADGCRRATLRRDIARDVDDFRVGFFDPIVDLFFESPEFTLDALEYFDLLHPIGILEKSCLVTIDRGVAITQGYRESHVRARRSSACLGR